MDALGFIKGENDISLSIVSAFANDNHEERVQLLSRESQLSQKLQFPKVYVPTSEYGRLPIKKTYSIINHRDFEIKQNNKNQSYYDIFANLFGKAAEPTEQRVGNTQQQLLQKQENHLTDKASKEFQNNPVNPRQTPEVKVIRNITSAMGGFRSISAPRERQTNLNSLSGQKNSTPSRLKIPQNAHVNIKVVRTNEPPKTDRPYDSPTRTLNPEHNSLALAKLHLPERGENQARTQQKGLRKMLNRSHAATERKIYTQQRKRDFSDRNEEYLQHKNSFFNDFDFEIKQRVIRESTWNAQGNKFNSTSYTGPRKLQSQKEKSVFEELEEFEKNKIRLKGVNPYFGRNRFIYKLDPGMQQTKANFF